VLIISASYSAIIERFPTGGGGYVVASHLLGPRTGVVSGCALVVDYVLTITVSIAGGGNAIFSFLPPHLLPWKLPVEAAVILLLIGLNLRGVKESVQALLPVFLVFLATHALLIGWALFSHAGKIPQVTHQLHQGFSSGLATLGLGGMALLLLRAYALGGGTYTGIEAVSNGLQIMREPRVATGKRTMVYMAVSLALTAGGILIGYLLLGVHHVPNQTMNAVLSEAVFGAWQLGGVHVGYALVLITLISEGLLLVDSYMPHRFAALSEQLSMQNGVLLMGLAALAMLFYTGGSVQVLVFMYSINVFLTFSLSQLGMTRFWWQRPAERTRKRHLALHVVALVLCVSILVVTVIERFTHGGWVTVLLTSIFVAVCYGIHSHYEGAKEGLQQLDSVLDTLPATGEARPKALDPKLPTAVLLVSSYNGFGVHTLLSILRYFPSLYKQFIFVSVAVVDSGSFKGKEEIEALQQHTAGDLEKYVEKTRRMGFAADSVWDVGIEVVSKASELCQQIAKLYPKATIFTGKLVFRHERFYYGFLHNETARAIQRRLQWVGVPMVVLPIRARV
jgi:amino acid transporter